MRRELDGGHLGKGKATRKTGKQVVKGTNDQANLYF